MRFVPGLFLSLLLPLISSAQGLTWQDLSGGSGYDVLIQPENGHFIGTNRRGVVYRSTDTAFSFSTILAYRAHDPILEVAARHQIAVASLIDVDLGSSNQVVYSTDQGSTWSRILSAGYTVFQNYSVGDSGYVYCVERFAGIFYRFDGRSFQPFGTALGALHAAGGTLHVTTDVSEDGTLFVGTPDNGLYVSTDGGSSWRHLLVSSSTSYSVSVISEGFRPGSMLVGTIPSAGGHTAGGVFVSDDGGLNWLGLGLTDRSITALAQDSAGNVFALADGQVYRHAASTGEWSAVGPPGYAFSALAVAGPATVIASSEASAIFRSHDSGIHWSGADLRGKDVFSVIDDADGIVYAGTLGSRVFRSSLAQLSWYQVPDGGICDNIYMLAREGASILAATDCGVFRSGNHGESWQKISDSTLAGSAYSLAVTGSGAIVAGTPFGVVRTTDRGASWSSAGLSAYKVLFLAISPAGTIFAATEQNGIFSSSNLGTTWFSRGAVGDDFQTITTNSAGHIFAGVYGGIVRSTDGGTTWATRSFTTVYVYALAHVGAQTVYAGTYSGVYVSTDNGDTWSPAGSDGLGAGVVLSLSLSNDSRLLAGTYRGGAFMSDQGVGTQSVDGVAEAGPVPRSSALAQNYPNPFNPVTNIQFAVADLRFVTLKVYDVLGREVATLVNETKPPGVYTVEWDATSQPSGVYFTRLQAGSYSDMRKLVLLK